jgi:hypothetical protein
VTISSDSEADEKLDGSRSRHSVTNLGKDLSSSPPPSPSLKRRPSDATQSISRKKKRVRGTPPPSTEDPARKYCIIKFEEMFVKIFIQHPRLVLDAGEADAEKAPVEQTEATEEDMAKVEETAKVFAASVEAAVFEVYSEPDKHGKPSVGGKYK